MVVVGGHITTSHAVRRFWRRRDLFTRLRGVEVNLQTGKVTVRRPSGLRPPRPRALRANLNVATKDKPLSRKS
jgi:hypothetical protein